MDNLLALVCLAKGLMMVDWQDTPGLRSIETGQTYKHP